ncbi:uncharacterized protein B0T15DRAFT_259862 [Chaetomium strumarium]|uniref:Uncharacterized protein n=1 Tax=Chaetomium strumarium TaxID=1170767 RepID=A0AAJ0LZ27_9PEZI|nr:hypothetical protein B0T15DRAFT_259862 [Chaetomium strumarium]
MVTFPKAARFENPRQSYWRPSSPSRPETGPTHTIAPPTRSNRRRTPASAAAPAAQRAARATTSVTSPAPAGSSTPQSPIAQSRRPSQHGPLAAQIVAPATDGAQEGSRNQLARASPKSDDLPSPSVAPSRARSTATSSTSSSSRPPSPPSSPPTPPGGPVPPTGAGFDAPDSDNETVLKICRSRMTGGETVFVRPRGRKPLELC